MKRITVHAYGFTREGADHVHKIAVCPDETPHEAATRIWSNIKHGGGTITDLCRTWPWDAMHEGGESDIEWHSPAHGKALEMWHKVTTAEPDEWPTMPKREGATK